MSMALLRTACSLMISVVIASRTESATLLQTNQLHTLQSGRDHQLAGIKEQVLAFAKNGVPDKAVDLLKTINTTLGTSVLQEIENERAAAEAFELVLEEKFENATRDFDNAIEGTTTISSEKTSRMGTHKRCRTEQNRIDTEEHQVCLGNLRTAKREYHSSEGDVTADFGSLTGQPMKGDDAACVSDIQWRKVGEVSDDSLTAMSEKLKGYATNIGELKEARNTFNEKLQECGVGEDVGTAKAPAAGTPLDPEVGTYKKWQDQIDTCDGNQVSYEEKSCELSKKLWEINKQFDDDWSAASTAFTNANDTFKVDSTNRFHQCQMVHHLMCYVTALVEKDDKAKLQESVNACDTYVADYMTWEDAMVGADVPYAMQCMNYIWITPGSPAQKDKATVPIAPCEVRRDNSVFGYDDAILVAAPTCCTNRWAGYNTEPLPTLEKKDEVQEDRPLEDIKGDLNPISVK